jgi:hypothetical protein
LASTNARSARRPRAIRHRLGDPDQHPALGRSTLAAESLLAVFQLTMTDAVEKAFGREV